ncbi:GntR family transcriptional regulator, partial [Streptomyces sp. NPDC049577]|uniref:FadR/GntR family transcriptional regulator n=1 Tax=Streptomyces sp. NPDC049577 TaxID=3155153 RepID=UPI0034450747
MTLRPVDRRSAVERATAQLRERVESGDWPVGGRIPSEPVLAEQLGVGRSAVREAVRALTHVGMLEPRQGSGTYVLQSA